MPLPVRTVNITQLFGPTSEPLDSGGFNKGVDFGGNVGDPVFSTGGGTVIQAGWGDDGWGISVKVQGDDGRIYNYGHMNNTYVRVGDRVDLGAQVGEIGNTGASTGPHLSYDVFDPGSGQYVDPSDVLGFPAAGDNRNGISGVPSGDIGPAGGTAGGRAGGSTLGPDYWEKRRQYDEIYSQYGLWLENPELAFSLGIPKPDPAILQQLYMLDAELGAVEDQYGQQAGLSPSDIINAYDFWNATDPRAIDAANASVKYGREFDTRKEAANIAATELSDQVNRVDQAAETQAGYGSGQGRMAVAYPGKLKSGEELFQAALERVKAGLPEVPDSPYPQRPSSIGDIMRAPSSGISGGGSYFNPSRKPLSGETTMPTGGFGGTATTMPGQVQPGEPGYDVAADAKPSMLSSLGTKPFAGGPIRAIGNGIDEKTRAGLRTADYGKNRRVLGSILAR